MRALAVAVVLGSIAAPRALAQAPEERGPLAFSEWDAGRIPAAGTMIRTRVFHPNGGGPHPLVGVIHGANANGSYHIELASTLASRGLVAVVPDMPCTVTSCDHDANQRQITALLEWAVAQGADPASRLSGLVDGSRRGLIGHSWGGLSSHLTAARDATIDSLVLLDPNDDAGVGLAATGTITAPVLQLLAEVPGACNSAWNEATVRAMLPAPNLQTTISGSGHCEPGEMDLVCSFACGSGDRATRPLFRRYAVAWTACVLLGDPAMGSWLGGADMSADEAAGRLESTFPTGLDGLPCRGAPPPIDGGTDAGPDAGTIEEIDAAAGEIDGGTTSAADAGTVAPSSGGCGCGVTAPRAPPALALVALAALARRRR
jgi:MYXO-CTERM domain-containing protein